MTSTFLYATGPLQISILTEGKRERQLLAGLRLPAFTNMYASS